jgi:hypothetical protein
MGSDEQAQFLDTVRNSSLLFCDGSGTGESDGFTPLGVGNNQQSDPSAPNSVALIGGALLRRPS